MIPKDFLRVLEHEGVVAIASQAPDGTPHLVNTWNSYVQITSDERLLIPVGGMRKTEENISQTKTVLLTAGSRDVQGKHGPGTGFLVTGTAEFSYAGEDFNVIKSMFAWARAALSVTPTSVTQTL